MKTNNIINANYPNQVLSLNEGVNVLK